MNAKLEDLTPFFEDRCWMFVLLATHASTAVILKRGPTQQWWHVWLWDTRTDTFQSGQWFRGRIYPDKCDLSPDGQLLVYFAGQWRRRNVAKGYHNTWTAVSRPPYLTALALWPMGDTWGGQGVFLDDRTVLVDSSKHHPDHPPGPLRVVEAGSLKKDDPLRDAVPCRQNGWSKVLTPEGTPEYRKPCGELFLGRDFTAHHWPSRRPTPFSIEHRLGQPVAAFQAHWADWDQQGRLVATVGGRVFAGNLTKNDQLRWRQLVTMNDELPTPLEAPPWAQRW